jgi:hypothetical protein
MHASLHSQQCTPSHLRVSLLVTTSVSCNIQRFQPKTRFSFSLLCNCLLAFRAMPVVEKYRHGATDDRSHLTCQSLECLLGGVFAEVPASRRKNLQPQAPPRSYPWWNGVTYSACRCEVSPTRIFSRPAKHRIRGSYPTTFICTSSPTHGRSYAVPGYTSTSM